MLAKILEVDLESRSTTVKEIPRAIEMKYLGGRGLGAYLLAKYVRGGTDPLSPENVLIFSAGPAQGTSTPYSSRTVLHTKSPLTGIYLYSVASGTFGPQLRRAGFASLVIKGKAKEPTYLIIKDGEVVFRPAQDLWGLDTYATFRELLSRSSLPRAAAVYIGPAGERQVRTACIVTEGEKARTFGRGGSGCVMGAKNLKGIVLQGTGEVAPADRPGLQKVKQMVREQLRQNPLWVEERRRFGSGADMMTLNALGVLPTRNWQTGVFAGVKNIAPSEIEHVWPRRTTTCGPYCLSPCSHIAEIDRGPYTGIRTEGPEYETIYIFGSNCGVDHFDAIVAAESICDRYGLDTMSVGAAIGFAMECYERGLLGKDDLNGLDLRFGNAAAMVEMVRLIAEGKGFGQILGQGVRRAAQQIPGSEDFAMHVKGLELGGYECRASWGQALQFAVNARGGCHHGYGLPARTEVAQGKGRQAEGKGQLIKRLATERILYDCSIICTFTRRVLGMDILGPLLESLTGYPYTKEELERIGWRIITLERLFNVREGLRRAEDRLPKRLLTEPLPDGPNRGAVVPLEDLLNEGYSALGWDPESGVPLCRVAEEIDLGVPELFALTV